MSNRKMPKRSVGGIYVSDMDQYLVDILKEKEKKLLKYIKKEKDLLQYHEIDEQINTVRYFIQKTKKKINKNK